MQMDEAGSEETLDRSSLGFKGEWSGYLRRQMPHQQRDGAGPADLKIG
jgi:hypothetical protein